MHESSTAPVTPRDFSRSRVDMLKKDFQAQGGLAAMKSKAGVGLRAAQPTADGILTSAVKGARGVGVGGIPRI